MNFRESIYERYQKVLVPGENVMLVNFPVHFNVGDQAIFLGEINIIESLGASVFSVHSNFNVNEFENQVIRTLKKLKTKPVIAIHGGGSFGAIWPKEEAARIQFLKVALKYSLKVIQFPQSVNFPNGVQDSSIDTIKEFQDKHEIFIFVRDSFSKGVLDHLGVRAILSPDCAHVLNVPRLSKPDKRFSILKRHDKESSNESITYSAIEWDWIDAIPVYMRITRFMMRLYGGMGKYLPWSTNIYSRNYAAWYSSVIFNAGVRRMQESELLYTDRLHAVLLCQMSEIEVTLIVDRYSKITNYLSTWGLSENLKILDAWPIDLEAFPRK